MGRREQREQVFRLLFQVEFHATEDMPRQMRLFLEGNEDIPSLENADYIEDRCKSIREQIPKIDQLIDENTEKWDTTRMGKVELTILRLALFELKFDEQIPTGVAIDEAVELAKKFGQEGSGAFVNGILAKFA